MNAALSVDDSLPLAASCVQGRTREAWLVRREMLVDARSAIDQELLEVNRHLNSSTPINTLPVEILAEILHVVQIHTFALPRDDAAALRWFRIFAVCSQWRAIVISNPLFWRSIVVQRNTELLSLSLERATRGSPVDIYFESADFPWKSLVYILQDWLDDIRTLHFERISANALVAGDLEELVGTRLLPTLVDLFIACEGSGYPRVPRIQDASSALQCLSLYGLMPTLNTTLYSRLPRLKLRNCAWVNFAWFLNMLEGCPQLEVLDLERSLPSDLDDFSDEQPLTISDGSRRPTVSLSRVRTLRLSGDLCDEIALVLSYLHFPNAREITIRGDKGADAEDTPVDGAIISMLPREPKTTFPALQSITSADVVVSDEVYEMYMQGSGDKASVALSLDGGEIFWTEDDAYQAIIELQTICHGAPITSLHFTGDFSPHATTKHWEADTWHWVLIFRHFECLESLQITGSGLCQSMWIALRASSSQSEACCPALRSVVLEELDDDGEEFHATALEPVCEALDVRAERGLRLYTLVLDFDLGRFDPIEGDAVDGYRNRLQHLVDNLTFFTRLGEQLEDGPPDLEDD